MGANRFRVGATYRWPPFAEGPTAVGREELAARLSVITDLPFAVVGQRAGVRPAVRDRRPLMARRKLAAVQRLATRWRNVST
jgi:hypothetical protein